MYFRIVVPPPLRSGWEVSHAIQTFHEASELFDEHEAFTVAESILENIPCKSPSQAAGLEGSFSKCKSADLNVDIGIPIASSEPNTRLRRLRPVHDGTDNWLIDLGQLFTEQAEEAFEGEAFCTCNRGTLTTSDIRTVADHAQSGSILILSHGLMISNMNGVIS